MYYLTYFEFVLFYRSDSNYFKIKFMNIGDTIKEFCSFNESYVEFTKSLDNSFYLSFNFYSFFDLYPFNYSIIIIVSFTILKLYFIKKVIYFVFIIQKLIW